MAVSILGDSKKKRYFDCIRAVTFLEARNAGATFFTRSCVVLRLERSEDYVQRKETLEWNHWRLRDWVSRWPAWTVVSRIQRHLLEVSRRWQKNYSKVSKEIVARRNKQVSRPCCVPPAERSRRFETVAWFSQTSKDEAEREERLWFCNDLCDQSEEEFQHPVVSDEFIVYFTRKTNFQNDFIWSKTPGEIPEKYREVVKSPDCVVVFIVFSVKKLSWISKPCGTSWDGPYFRPMTPFHERPCLCSWCARGYNSSQQSPLHEGPRNSPPSQRQGDRLFFKTMNGQPFTLLHYLLANKCDLEGSSWRCDTAETHSSQFFLVMFWRRDSVKWFRT